MMNCGGPSKNLPSAVAGNSKTGLVDLLLHDVGHEPGALPLLSHALMETWQRRRGRMMTLSGYTSSGGVRGAIAETAEAVFARSVLRMSSRRLPAVFSCD